jgi:hypothetical protein
MHHWRQQRILMPHLELLEQELVQEQEQEQEQEQALVVAVEPLSVKKLPLSLRLTSLLDRQQGILMPHLELLEQELVQEQEQALVVAVEPLSVKKMTLSLSLSSLLDRQ